MHSIFNHDYNDNKPTTPLNSQKYDSKSSSYNTNTYAQYGGGQNSQVNIKQLYKNHLDTLMQEKEKLKKLEKEMLLKQKQEYCQKMRVGQQNQKLKDLAYKNYYKVLMESQDHNKEMYISPYEMSDKLKESHIQKSIQQEMQKSQNYQYEKRMRQADRKNQYRQQLTRQIQQRKRFQEMKKSNLQDEKQYYRQHTKSPNQIDSYQREKKKEEMQLYRHDLDRIMQDKLSMSRKDSQTNYDSRPAMSEHFHNPVINPLPYNIQNPYILKEMQKLSSSNMRNDHQLNDQHNSYQFSDKNKNTSSYFARQGNTLLK